MEKPLVILQITDSHLLEQAGATLSGIDTEKSLEQVLEHVYSSYNKINLILVTGDLAQTPSPSSYKKMLKMLQKHQTPAVCLPGNHDNLALMQQIINSPSINCAPHNLFKHWQIICLNSKKTNSHGGYLPDNELNFLTESLLKHPGLNSLIAVHHHCTPTHSQWMDTMIIENNDKLLNILKQFPRIKAITCGHIHQELAFKINNQWLFGTPSTCFQFKPLCVEYAVDGTPPGYRMLWLHPDGNIQTKVHYLPTKP